MHVKTSLLGAVVLLVASLRLAQSAVGCDFNNGTLCKAWDQGINYIIDEFDWSVGFSKGQINDSDHEANSMNNTHIGDYFFYMATTKHLPNHRAVFATPVMTSSDGHVNISFLFCMFGDQTQRLSVYIKDMSMVSSESEIWSRNGREADVWTTVSKNANVTGPFRVIFQGKVGKGSAAIAIDDILIGNAEILRDANTLQSTSPTSERSDSTLADVHSTVNCINATKLVPMGTTTLSELFDMETVPLIVAAAGGMIFWLGVLTLITYFTCRKSRRNNNRHVRKTDSMKTLKMAAVQNGTLDVSYVPRRRQEIKIIRVPDPGYLESEPVYSNQIPCVFNYDPLTNTSDNSSRRYSQCSPVHDYATIP